MALRVEAVVKSYGRTTAVDGVSFTVPEGSIFGLLGANGAGKTTTARMILNIINPDQGRITWGETPVEKVDRLHFGYLPEERGLYPDVRVSDQLRFFARIRGLNAKEVRRSTEAWIDRLNVGKYRDMKVRELSKGNQQRVQFAAAVLHEPSLIILDEPFSGLDPVGTELLKEVILELNEQGSTLLLSTHDMEQVEELCHNVGLINRAKLVFSGSLDEVRRRYHHRRVLHIILDTFSGSDIPQLLRNFPGLEVVREQPGCVELAVSGVDRSQDLLKEALHHGRVRSFREVEPSLREIFIEEVGKANE